MVSFHTGLTHLTHLTLELLQPTNVILAIPSLVVQRGHVLESILGVALLPPAEVCTGVRTRGAGGNAPYLKTSGHCPACFQQTGVVGLVAMIIQTCNQNAHNLQGFN